MYIIIKLQYVSQWNASLMNLRLELRDFFKFNNLEARAAVTSHISYQLTTLTSEY